jgi:hypothetical protein
MSASCISIHIFYVRLCVCCTAIAYIEGRQAATKKKKRRKRGGGERERERRRKR